MSAGQTVILSGPYAKARAHRLIEAAPMNAVVNVREATRTNAQNDKLWAMLSDVSLAKPGGRVMPPDRWKCLFMAEAGFAFDWEPGLDGQGVVPVGFRSSRLTKAEFSDLIECIQEYAARHGIQMSEAA